MLKNKEKQQEHFVDIDLEMQLLKLGLTVGCSLDDFESAVAKLTSKNFISVWKQSYARLSAKLSDRNPSESIAIEYVRKKMGWSSSTNMQAYLSGAKTIGLTNANRLAKVMECRVEDIHPLVGNEYLSDYHKKLKAEENSKKSKRSEVIGKNVAKFWSDYKKKNPKVTQEAFCKTHLSIKNQSNFSQMLKGKASFSKKRVEALAVAFNCNPVEIDPHYTIELDEGTKSTIRQLVDMLKSKPLDEAEENAVNLIASSVL